MWLGGGAYMPARNRVKIVNIDISNILCLKFQNAKLPREPWK